MKKLLLSSVLLICFFNLFAQQNINGHFLFQNKTREYIVHLPTSYSFSQKYPLYICLHGGGSTDSQIMDYTNLNNVSDTGEFIAVYPQGYSNSWADGRGTSDADLAGIDDVGFISRLVDTLVKKYNADTMHVYAAGISNGGFMVQRLLCRLGNKIAAGASVAAQVIDSVDYIKACPNLCSKPVIFIHGTKDNYVPYNGGPVNGQNGGNGKDGYTLSVDSSAALWAKKNGCSTNIAGINLPNKVLSDFCRPVKITYTNCAGQNNVIVYKIIDGGHTWPGADASIITGVLLGRTNQDINAGVEIWNFFKTKSLVNCGGINQIQTKNDEPIKAEY